MYADFDADNGVFVWVNGIYKFGARGPGLLLALLGLAHLAAPLADPLLAAGRGGRYLGAAAPGGGLSGLLQAAQAA